MDSQIVLALYHWAAASAVISALVVAIAQYAIFLLPLAVVVIWFWPGADTPARRQAVLAALVSGAIAVVLVVVVGHLVVRARPFVVLGLTPLFPHAIDSSFPSDHELGSMAVALPILWARPRIGIWLTIWALLIGFARVASAVHWPTDILGSMAIAVVPAVVGLVLVAAVLSRIAPIRAWAEMLGVLEEPLGRSA